MILKSRSQSASLEPRPVLILQRILAPYRLAFFQALARSPKLALTLAYGQASPQSALESVYNPPGIQTSSLRNIYFGKNERVILQSGSLPLLNPNHFSTVIAEFNPRIITNVLACLLARQRGLKFIWWGHGFRPKSSPVDKWIYRYLASVASALIFYSAKGAEDLISQGIPREKTFVSWNSIDSEEIERLRLPTQIEDRTRILYIGRLIPEKKVSLLIRSFALALPTIDAKISLTIIGDGPELQLLKNMAKNHNIADRIEFIGSIYDQTRLAPYFNTAIASVSAGYIGLSAIHSLAYGIPMIVADKEPHSPEIKAIENGVNSVFFPSDDAEALSRAIVDLISSPNNQKVMSVAALRTIRLRFSTNGMVEAFEAAIEYAHK